MVFAFVNIFTRAIVQPKSRMTFTKISARQIDTISMTAQGWNILTFVNVLTGAFDLYFSKSNVAFALMSSRSIDTHLITTSVVLFQTFVIVFASLPI